MCMSVVLKMWLGTHLRSGEPTKAFIHAERAEKQDALFSGNDLLCTVSFMWLQGACSVVEQPASMLQMLVRFP